MQINKKTIFNIGGYFYASVFVLTLVNSMLPFSFNILMPNRDILKHFLQFSTTLYAVDIFDKNKL